MERPLVLGLAYGLYNAVLFAALKTQRASGVMLVTGAHFVVGGVFALWDMSVQKRDPIKDRYEGLKTFRGATLGLVDLFILISFVLATTSTRRRGDNNKIVFGISWAMALFSNLVCLVDQYFLFAPNAAGKLNVLGHDRDTLGVDGNEVSIFKKAHKVGLGCLLDGLERVLLPS